MASQQQQIRRAICSSEVKSRTPETADHTPPGATSSRPGQQTLQVYHRRNTADLRESNPPVRQQNSAVVDLQPSQRIQAIRVLPSRRNPEQLRSIAVETCSWRSKCRWWCFPRHSRQRPDWPVAARTTVSTPARRGMATRVYTRWPNWSEQGAPPSTNRWRTDHNARRNRLQEVFKLEKVGQSHCLRIEIHQESTSPMPKENGKRQLEGWWRSALNARTRGSRAPLDQSESEKPQRSSEERGTERAQPVHRSSWNHQGRRQSRQGPSILRVQTSSNTPSRSLDISLANAKHAPAWTHRRGGNSSEDKGSIGSWGLTTWQSLSSSDVFSAGRWKLRSSHKSWPTYQAVA